MADAAGGGPQILEALLKTDSASSWNQDKLADFGKKTRREARALVKGGGGDGGDDVDAMDADEVRLEAHLGGAGVHARIPSSDQSLYLLI